MNSDNPVHFRAYEKLMSPAVQAFLDAHAIADIHAVLLKGKEVDGVPAAILASQLKGRAVAKEKFPDLVSPSIIYPPGLNLEQSSSTTTAQFKAELLSQLVDTDSIADITGGFGIDTYHFSKYFRNVDYVEPNSLLANIAAHNHRVLGATNIQHQTATAEAFLAGPGPMRSVIYVDPSRRVNARRVVSLSECEPDVVRLRPEIFKRANALMVKASPMLDISHSIAQLGSVQRVIVVSVHQECRELLFFCDNKPVAEPVIVTIHINTGGREVFEFVPSAERDAQISFGDVDAYLYEPNPSILKAGAFKLIATRFGLTKLHPNSHLYTSNTLVPDFPGRRFSVVSHLKSDPSTIARTLPERKANVMVRNYPLSADSLKKKLKVTDGGSLFIIGTTAGKNPVLVLAERV